MTAECRADVVRVTSQRLCDLANQGDWKHDKNVPTPRSDPITLASSSAVFRKSGEIESQIIQMVCKNLNSVACVSILLRGWVWNFIIPNYGTCLAGAIVSPRRMRGDVLERDDES